MDMRRLIIVLCLVSASAHAEVAGLVDTATGAYVDPATQAELNTHEGTADAHHDPITLNAAITSVLSLTTQEISAVDAGAADALVAWDDTAGALAYMTGADVIAIFSGSVSGDISLTTAGVAALSADSVSTDEMADADHGDVAWSSGAATVQSFNLTGDADAGDFDITSVDQLQGVSTSEFVDLGTSGVAQIAATAIHLDAGSETLTVSSGTDSITLGTDTGVTRIGSTLQFATTGAVIGAINVVAKTAATYTVGTDDALEPYGTLFFNGDNDAIDFTLPQAVAGMSMCFFQGNGSTAAITVQPGTGDQLCLDSVLLTAGTDYTSSGTGADKLCIIAKNDYVWTISMISGTWSE